MAIQEFAPKPYYEIAEGAIYDTRVTALLSELALATEPVIEIPQQRQETPHQVKCIDSRGHDGETESGAIEIVDIRTHDGRHAAAICSWQFEHETGLPTNSWMAEFDDTSVAKSFWRIWQAKFAAPDSIKDIKLFLQDHPELPLGSIHFQQLGLLLPWYQQQPGDRRFLDVFSTNAEKLVTIPKQHPVEPSYAPGQVYKVPRTEWYMTKVTAWTAKTCLAAFVAKTNEPSVAGSVQSDSIYVQWSDGLLGEYVQRPKTPQPVPLASWDLARPKPVEVVS